MVIDDEAIKFYQIFHPGLIEEFSSVEKENKKFVYYTSADTAIKVIQGKRLWFRNATVMNDYSEISYGLDLMRKVFSGEAGVQFKKAIEEIHTGTINDVDQLITAWERDWRLETYIACISTHCREEDENGRLSMWRAYGNTALVIKNTPMVAITDKLNVHSIPVLYMNEKDLFKYISIVTKAIIANISYLRGLGKNTLIGYLHHMLLRFAIGTKHPGFAEEKEWRLFYRPTEKLSPAMEEEIVVLDGVPQKIYKLPLAHEPEKGLYGADISSLLDRIIIGPTEFPYVSYQAFSSVLATAKVKDAPHKVFISEIPLRTR